MSLQVRHKDGRTYRVRGGHWTEEFFERIKRAGLGMVCVLVEDDQGNSRSLPIDDLSIEEVKAA